MAANGRILVASNQHTASSSLTRWALFMDMGLSGPFQRLDVQGFKITPKIAPQASHTVRQAIWGLLLDGYTGVQIDRALIPSVYTGYIARYLSLNVLHPQNRCFQSL